MYDIYVLTPGGLENIAKQDIEKIIGHGANIVERGLIKAKCGEAEIIKLNIWGRTFTRVLLGIGEGVFVELDDLINAVSEIDYTQFFKDGYSFAVRCSRSGKHNFTSIDAARGVGGVIHKKLLDAGMDIHVDLKNPTIEFILKIYEDRFYLGINTSGEGLNKRGYRIYSHPAALNPVIASGMISLLEWDGNNMLIDPMCGGATIPIEAIMSILNYAPGLYRKCHPLIWIPIFDQNHYWNIKKEAEEFKVDMDRKLSYAIEISSKHIEGGIKNAYSAGVEKYIKFILGDSRMLNKYIENDEYLFAFNPPYGIRLTRPGALPKIYYETLNSLNKLGGYRGVVITSATDIFEKTSIKAGYIIKRKLNVMHGNIKATIYLIET